MKRVLIASDDAHTRAWVMNALGALDVSLTEVPFEEMVSAIVSGDVDAVVLDGGRDPGSQMLAVDAALNGGAEIKVLLLVEADHLAELRMSARPSADFIVRGASSEEVTARMRTLLWPGEEATSQEFVRIDDLTLNLATYQAYRGADPIDFTYLEYALFAFLVTHPNRAYSRETLLRRVWGTDYYGGLRTVDVHIRRIRSKIGPELGKRLETVRNVGYLWSG